MTLIKGSILPSVMNQFCVKNIYDEAESKFTIKISKIIITHASRQVKKYAIPDIDFKNPYQIPYMK